MSLAVFMGSYAKWTPLLLILKDFSKNWIKIFQSFILFYPSVKYGCSMLKNKTVILFPWQPAQEDGSEALPERLTQR